jgi:ribonuclease III
VSGDVTAFFAEQLGHQPRDAAMFEAALTHSSSRGDNYERLEFLGDRVLGLVIARWLYERFPEDPEGNLSRRFNTLVDRVTCSDVGREIGLPALIRLGKQAREDAANWSDNVVGDVVEALIRRLWGPLIEGQRGVPKHPKSALQELAAARDLPNPHYEVVSRTGVHHAPKFTVRVSINSAGEAEAEGPSKQEAETEAAKALLQRLQ